MKIQLTILTIDILAQMITLIITGVLLLLFFLADADFLIMLGFALLALGGWQLLSGIIMGIIRHDRTRGVYEALSIFYLAVLFVGAASSLQKTFGKSFGDIIAFIFIALIPTGIGIWYFLHSKKDWQKLREETKGLVKIDNSMKNILDSEEIFKRKL